MGIFHFISKRNAVALASVAALLGIAGWQAPSVLAAQNCQLNAFHGTVTVDGTATNDVNVTLTDLTNGANPLSTTTSNGGLYLIETANLSACADVGDQIKVTASFDGAEKSSTLTYASQAATQVNLAITSSQPETTPPPPETTPPPPTPVLTTINVTPLNPSLTVGSNTGFSAATLDQSGSPINASVSWTSSNTSVGTISNSGTFNALATGTTTVSAVSGSISETSLLTVNAATATSTNNETTPPPPSPEGNTGGNNENNGNGGSSGGANDTVSIAAALGGSFVRKVGDINRDLGINIKDFNLLMIDWGKQGISLLTDLNRDGAVDIEDFNLLMVYWGK